MCIVLYSIVQEFVLFFPPSPPKYPYNFNTIFYALNCAILDFGLANYFICNTQELEALSSHYALLFNRRKAKLSAEQKSVYDGKLKEVQQIFNLNTEIDRSNADSNKGKTIKKGNEGSSDEMKNLHDSSVGKAAEMAGG